MLLLRKEREVTKERKEEAKTRTYRNNIFSWWEAGSPLNVLGFLLMPPSARLMTQGLRGTTLLRSHRPISLTYCSRHIIFPSRPHFKGKRLVNTWFQLQSWSCKWRCIFFAFSTPRQGLKAKFKLTYIFYKTRGASVLLICGLDTQVCLLMATFLAAWISK